MFFGQWSFKKNAYEIYWPLEPKYLVLDTICMTLDTPIEKYPWFNTLKMGGWVGGWVRKSQNYADVIFEWSLSKQENLIKLCISSTTKSWLLPKTQWISLLNRRVQKIEQIQPHHCAIYQKNHNKKCNWMALVSQIGFGGNISQISIKCWKSLNLIKILKSWMFIISLKTFGGLINYFE